MFTQALVKTHVDIKPPLTEQYVGAFFRSRPDLVYPASKWGDPKLDYTITKEMLMCYTQQEYIAWCIANQKMLAPSYGDRFAGLWNTCSQVAVDVEGKLPRMHYYEDQTYKVTSLVGGIAQVFPALEQLNHQLASLIVATSPPAQSALGKGEIAPSPCDPKGIFGPPVSLVTYLDPVLDSEGQIYEESKDGGFVHQAYANNKHGGVEGIVKTIEKNFNKPFTGTPAENHVGYIELMDRRLQAAKTTSGAKVPQWCEPFETVTMKGKQVKRMRNVTQVSCPPYKNLDSHYIMYQLMSTTCGIGRRAAYVHDGHYFADLPAGTAEKIHRLDNLMQTFYYVQCDVMGVNALPSPVDKLKQLIPLNLPCSSYEATVRYENRPPIPETPFHDRRFTPGFYLPPKKARYFVFRPMEYKRPSVSPSMVAYTPATPNDEINRICKNFPPAVGNLVCFVTIAHESLWADKQNFIHPFDLLDGLVCVCRAAWINADAVGHMDLKVYLAKVSLFMNSRKLYPYSRLSWPQLSGMPHSRVVLKKGQISVVASLYTDILAQLDLSDQYTWESNNEIYEKMWDAPVPKYVESVAVHSPSPPQLMGIPYTPAEDMAAEHADQATGITTITVIHNVDTGGGTDDFDLDSLYDQ